MTIVAADIVAFSDAYWANAGIASEATLPRSVWPLRSLLPCLPAIADFELQQKLKVARQRYATFTTPDERALVLFDATFFGSGGEGFVVSNRALYIKPYTNDPVTIERPEIGQLVVRRDGPHTVMVLPNQQEPVASFACEPIEHLLIRDFFARIGSGRFTHTVQDLLCLMDPSIGYAALELVKQAGVGLLTLDALRLQLPPDAAVAAHCGPLMVIERQVVVGPDHLLSLKDIDEVVITRRISERIQRPVNEDDRKNFLQRMTGGIGGLPMKAYSKLTYRADVLGYDLQILSRAHGKIPSIAYQPQAAMMLNMTVAQLRELGVAVVAPAFTTDRS